MFLKICSIALCFALGMTLSAAGNITCTHNRITFPAKSILLQKQGNVILMGKDLYMNTSLNVGTRSGYNVFGSKAVNGIFSNPVKGLWEYKGNFPENTDGRKLEVSQSVEVTPMGTVEFSFQWKAGNARNLTDLFFMVSFPIKHFAGKKILVDQQAVPVADVTKYGFFRKNSSQNSTITFYAWEEAKSFSIQTEGPVRILLQSIKNKNVIVRFYPDPASGNMKLIFKF